MGWIAILVAILCGIVLVIEVDTGNLSSGQVAGVGIIAAAIAIVAPRTWPPSA